MGIAIGIVIGLVAGGALVVGWLALTGSSKLAAARRTRQLLLEDARREADALRREAQLEAKEEAVSLREQVEEELKERQVESVRLQGQLTSHESELRRRETELERREQGVTDREMHAKALQEELKSAKDRELLELERVSGMTVNEAKQEVLTRSEELVRHELARRVRQLEEEAQSEARRRARNLAADALQRGAAGHAAGATASLGGAPSHDLKGRVNGRQGRH